MKLLGQLKSDMQLPGETLTEFAAEYRKLTDADKADLRQWYADEGTVLDPEA